MKNNLLFYVLFGIALLIPKAYSSNPIRNGLPEYGIRDCHILYDKHSYFKHCSSAATAYPSTADSVTAGTPRNYITSADGTY